MALFLSIAAVVISMVSAAASLGLWRSARRANRTASEVAFRDEARRHEEVAPDFAIEFANNGTDLQSAWLTIRLVRGPTKLDVLVRIQDEVGQDHWAHGLPSGLSANDAENFVWGPWEFSIGASEQVDSYRQTKVRRYNQVTGEDWDRLQLARTRPGAWMQGTSDVQWQEQRQGPMRLLITSQATDGETWYRAIDVPW